MYFYCNHEKVLDFGTTFIKISWQQKQVRKAENTLVFVFIYQHNALTCLGLYESAEGSLYEWTYVTEAG